jgi:glutathione peroxidase
MTGRQKIMKLIYPVLIKVGSRLGFKSKTMANYNAAKPIHSIFDLIVQLNSGKEIKLESYKGKKLLIVNTASNCGYTPQYEALQSLYEQFNPQLEIIGFPSNDFKEQEPGSDEEIAEFCKVNYGVSFPLVKKSRVVPGEGQHPVYAWLSSPEENGWCRQVPEWNFSKYLLNERGELTHYFAPGISPLDKTVVDAIRQ